MPELVLNVPDDTLEQARLIAAQRGQKVEDVLIEWVKHGAGGLLRLYTIGHSDLTAEALIDHLRQHQVTELIDVRSVPFSKYFPQHNRESLQSALKQAGINYRFAGDSLGGRPSDSEVYKDQVQPDPKTTKRQEFLELVRYVEVMKRDWYQKGIERLLAIVRETGAGHVAIMCSEGHPHECHRHHLIARSLVDPAVRVVNVDIVVYHILRDAQILPVTVENFESHPQQLSLF